MLYRKPTFTSLFITLLLSWGTAPAFGSGPWQHVASTHFGLSYTPATAHLVADAAEIAEETRTALTEYFGDTVDLRFLSIVLSDESDIPNGGASVLDPVVWIDCRKAQSLFRGETDWLRTVLTHELSHQYSLQMLKKVEWLKAADNVTLRGENVRMSWNTAKGPVELPLWFVEGLAQMGSRRASADQHDAIRRMVLREALATGRALSLEAMGRFEGTHRDQELVYNQGFALLQYMEESYPNVSLARLCAVVLEKGFNQAFASLYQTSPEEMYRSWRASWESTATESTETAASGTALFARDGAMVVETSTAGPYVVANWDNDFHRFGLFRMRGQETELVARDTGLVVKSPEGKDAWYSQQTFDVSRGTVGYEVFHLDSRGVNRQVTYNARVLAFDVLDGRLGYARYREGQTELVVQSPDGAETVLGTIPPGTAVYSISLVNFGTMLVSLGTGPRVNAAVATKDSLSLLWPEAEVMDVVAVGEDRVVFSSTWGGSPQLYWVDLVQAPTVWHIITRVPFGARFPSWDERTSQLTFSEYREGGWHRVAWVGELPAAEGVTVPGPAVQPWLKTSPRKPLSLRTMAANPIVHVEPITLGAFLQKGTTEPLAMLGLVGWSATVFNAPKDWSLSARYQIQNLFDSIPTQPSHEVLVEATTEWGPLSNYLSFHLATESEYYNRYGYEFLTYLHRSGVAQTTLRTARDQSVSLSYQGQWSDHTTLSPAETFLGLHTGSIRWDWSHSPFSVFDPARLGQTGWGGYFVGRLVVPEIVHHNYWNPAVILLNNGPVPQGATGWGYQALVGGSRLSVGAAVEALASPGAVSGSRAFPWALSDLNAAGFSGYPSGYASMASLGLGRLSLRTNPLVETKDATHWYERLSLGASIVGGAGQYFDAWGERGLRLGYPVSVEVGISAAYYAAPDHASDVDLRFAMALNDFAAAQGAKPIVPYQVSMQYRY